jgi:hypothetical protein
VEYIYLAQNKDRWRPLVNGKSWTYLRNKYKILSTSQQNMRHFWSILRLNERHCECCGLQSVQLTDEAIEARRWAVHRCSRLKLHRWAENKLVPSRTFCPVLSPEDWLKRKSERERGVDVTIRVFLNFPFVVRGHSTGKRVCISFHLYAFFVN